MTYSNIPSHYIVREVIPVKAHARGSSYKELKYNSFEEACQAFEEMYRIDKMLYQVVVAHNPHGQCLSDSSWDYDNYTFSANGNMLHVSLKTAVEVAKDIFGDFD